MMKLKKAVAMILMMAMVCSLVAVVQAEETAGLVVAEASVSVEPPPDARGSC